MRNIPVTEEKLEDIYLTSETYLRRISFTNSNQIQEMKQAIREVIQTELTDRQRELVQMYFMDGMSMREIAKQKGITKQSVSTTIQRAVKRIKKSKKIKKFFDIG
ncbi:MAG: sigma-70 family RNA polymerase sigma factor [Firmicutes bacterium]|nr:sigma-70 family RNA polymerase sigma factor [Bacillota bacterium]